MANSGILNSYGNDAQNSFNCIVEMNEKLVGLNKGRKSAGLPEIQNIFEIHFGPWV